MCLHTCFLYDARTLTNTQTCVCARTQKPSEEEEKKKKNIAAVAASVAGEAFKGKSRNFTEEESYLVGKTVSDKRTVDRMNAIDSWVCVLQNCCCDHVSPIFLMRALSLQNEKIQKRVRSAGAGASRGLSERVNELRSNAVARAELHERCLVHMKVSLCVCV